MLLKTSGRSKPSRPHGTFHKMARPGSADAPARTTRPRAGREPPARAVRGRAGGAGRAGRRAVALSALAQIARWRRQAFMAAAFGQGPDVVQLLAQPVVVRQARQRAVDDGGQGLEGGVARGGVVVSHGSLLSAYGDLPVMSGLGTRRCRAH